MAHIQTPKRQAKRSNEDFRRRVRNQIRPKVAMTVGMAMYAWVSAWKKPSADQAVRRIHRINDGGSQGEIQTYEQTPMMSTVRTPRSSARTMETAPKAMPNVPNALVRATAPDSAPASTKFQAP